MAYLQKKGADMTSWAVILVLAAVEWRHPAGSLSDDTIAEMREKTEGQAWARAALQAQGQQVSQWAEVPMKQLREVFPAKRGNVYHNFSCPEDRIRLVFNPFESARFHCATCGKDFEPALDAGIYPKGDRYNGTLYDGWACLFYESASSSAATLALLGRMENRPEWRERACELLRLYANVIQTLPTVQRGEGDAARIFTYAREGDNLILNELAQAYELVRGEMSEEERKLIEEQVLKRMLDDIMLQPIYTFDHNNIYQWHRTVLQAALALERADLIDWSFGYGQFSPENAPEHRSIRRIIATHFKPDGAFWELCSGYHLYPMNAFCELAFLSRAIARMDPKRFPPQDYDLTDPRNPGGKIIKNALEWFISMAMPDRSMTIIGDSPAPRSGMDSYATTAEVGYRFFDVRAVGDYAALREGKRSWVGLLFGAPQIVQQPTPFTSSYLSSGWVSLRSEWQGNRVWAGLNALIPGGGHQHADRLTLTLFSQGQLLALEKTTPYNELTLRDLGTFSPMHNTVSVDMASQKQGEALAGQEIPQVTVFCSAPWAQFAEVQGDHIYPQTQVYRRSVALIEDIALDLFRVTGGKTHDWLLHHAGAAPALSLLMAPGAFEPGAWLHQGSQRVLRAATDADWNAQWKVADVNAGLFMLGGEGTQVYALETYPVGNATVTEDFPPCQTLCVRRENDEPFLAVWHAWREQSNLQSVRRLPGQDAVLLSTKGNTYHVLFGPGEAEFPDGLRMTGDAAFSVLRNEDACIMAGGTRLEFHSGDKTHALLLSEAGNAWADWAQGETQRGVSSRIAYDTHGGEDHPRDASSLVLTVK